MAAPTKKINLSGLARKLLLDEEKAQSAFEESLKKKKPFVSLVVENKLVPRRLSENSKNGYFVKINALFINGLKIKFCEKTSSRTAS